MKVCYVLVTVCTAQAMTRWWHLINVWVSLPAFSSNSTFQVMSDVVLLASLYLATMFLQFFLGQKLIRHVVNPIFIGFDRLPDWRTHKCCRSGETVESISRIYYTVKRRIILNSYLGISYLDIAAKGGRGGEKCSTQILILTIIMKLLGIDVSRYF